MPVLTDSEVRALRDTIATKERTRADKMEAAEKLAASMREAGTNPLLDKDAFDKVDAAYREAGELANEVDDLRARLMRGLDMAGEVGEARQREADEQAARHGSMGDRLLDSPQYRALRESGVLESGGSQVRMDPVEISSRDEVLTSLRTRATVDVTNILVAEDQRVTDPIAIPVRSPRFVDFINVVGTDSDTVEWVKMTTRTDNVANTAYGTAAPEGTYVYERQTESVRRIPTSVPATKGNLADSSQLRGLLGSNLQSAVDRHLESQVLGGDGTGENFRGVYNTVGINTFARGADTKLDALHKAITAIRLSLFGEPNGIGIHPSDHEALVLHKDSSGNYVLGPATQEGAKRAWGLPLAPSTAITEGQPIVADWKQATLWLRSGVTVSASDSHSDFFTKGLVMLLAEMRAAFVVTQPKGVTVVTGFNV